jgi:serine/threonine-protein kinase RsbW
MGAEMDETRFRALEMHIPADTRYLSVVRRGVRNLAESMGFAREDVADVELAVSEAVTNSVEHGSAPDGEPAVVVKCCGFDDLLVVEVEDESRADSIPQGREPPAYEERGRGVLMMRALMDECEDCRTDQGIRVRMIKQKAHAGPA